MSTENQPSQVPVDAPRPESEGGSGSPLEQAQSTANERPELVVAGAFAGAFVLAQVLKRIGGGS